MGLANYKREYNCIMVRDSFHIFIHLMTDSTSKRAVREKCLEAGLDPDKNFAHQDPEKLQAIFNAVRPLRIRDELVADYRLC